MFRLLLVVALSLGAQGASDVQGIASVGYPVETHNVTTSDGYILQLVRIPYGKNSTNSTSAREVVFLMHGLLGCFNSFTYLDSKYGMAFNFADAGYDVWMGNARGNSYSRRHVSLDPDSDKLQFFKFSFQEIALYDMPAMIDYVLATTNQDQLHYVGHSQGGTVFLVLNSIIPSYQSKISSAHLMAGIGYETEFPNKVVKRLSTAIDILYDVAVLTGYVEFKPSSPLTTVFAEILLNSTVPQDLIAGASVRQAMHYGQNFRDQAFRQWNYGAVGNLLKYSNIVRTYSTNILPPSYDLSKIKVNITLHYSLGDITQSETDVLAMAQEMPNARARKLAKTDFDHVDYLVRNDVKELVTDFIISSWQS